MTRTGIAEALEVTPVSGWRMKMKIEYEHMSHPVRGVGESVEY